jgi:hypothetical protein
MVWPIRLQERFEEITFLDARDSRHAQSHEHLPRSWRHDIRLDSYFRRGLNNRCGLWYGRVAMNDRSASRRASPAVLVVFVFLFAACARVTPCPKVASSFGTVIVMNAGAEPRARLAYKPIRPFDSYVFRVVKRTASDGSEDSASNYEATLAITPREDFCFDVSLEKQNYFYQSRRSYGAFTRSATGRSIADIRGVLPADKLDYALGQMVETQLEEFPVVLPTEPVGLGAHWTYSRPFAKHGFRFEQRIDYTLEAQEGDRLTLGMVFVSLAKPQTYHGPSAAAIQPLESFLEEGRGRIEVNLGAPLPSGAFHVDLTHTVERTWTKQPPATTKGSMEMTLELRED